MGDCCEILNDDPASPQKSWGCARGSLPAPYQDMDGPGWREGVVAASPPPCDSITAMDLESRTALDGTVVVDHQLEPAPAASRHGDRVRPVQRAASSAAVQKLRIMILHNRKRADCGFLVPPVWSPRRRALWPKAHHTPWGNIAPSADVIITLSEIGPNASRLALQSQRITSEACIRNQVFSVSLTHTQDLYQQLRDLYIPEVLEFVDPLLALLDDRHAHPSEPVQEI